MSSQLVLLSSAPNQALRLALNVNGSALTLSLNQYYNRVGGFWMFDISNAQGVLLVGSVPLVTGDWPGANILAPYEYLQIGEAYVINQNGAASDIPNSTNLAQFSLLWTDNVGSGIAPGFPTVPPVSGSGEWSSYNVNGLSTVLG